MPRRKPSLVAETFGQRCRAERMRKGLTQGELAEALGTAQGYISAIERDEANPTKSFMERFAEAVGCRVRDLF